MPFNFNDFKDLKYNKKRYIVELRLIIAIGKNNR